MPADHLPIFVYGTLKRGEQREMMWPAPAQGIEEATTRGRLYDLGPYPAMVDGPDLVAGQLWHVAPEDLEVTLAALDEIECYGANDVDLYVRRIVDCRAEGGSSQRAYTYLLANTGQLAGRSPIPPGVDRRCRWQTLQGF